MVRDWKPPTEVGYEVKRYIAEVHGMPFAFWEVCWDSAWLALKHVAPNSHPSQLMPADVYYREALFSGPVREDAEKEDKVQKPQSQALTQIGWEGMPMWDY